MLKSILLILLLGLQILYAQTEAQKEFLHYCLHEATPAQVHTIMVAADEPTLERSCNYLARTKIPLGSRKAIRLSNSNITDITPLKYLKGVTEVTMEGNQVTDITPLAELSELRKINLSYNPIREIKSLLELKKLKSLTLYSNYKLQDASLLGKITTLESLSFSDLNCNTSFIRKLTKLEWLSIIRVDLKDLKELSLSTTHLEDISDIIYLKNITHLELNKQPLLTDISPLKSLKKLKYLHIENVPIKDISALKELPNLKSLTLCNTKVADLSVLSGKHIELDQRDNDLRWCSPKKGDDLIKGVSCYEKDGTEKNWWKRVLRL